MGNRAVIQIIEKLVNLCTYNNIKIPQEIVKDIENLLDNIRLELA